MTDEITMSDVRLVAGEGTLTAAVILQACNVIFKQRGRQITLAHDTIIGPIRFDAGTYRIQRMDDIRCIPIF